MDNYIVSARKYRPTTFDSVVGQSTLTTTLKNAIATGKLAHAFLFCGPRGVGKPQGGRRGMQRVRELPRLRRATLAQHL